MAIAELTSQRASMTSAGSVTSAQTLAFPGNVTAGNLLVVGGSTVGNASTPRVVITATGAGAPSLGWALVPAPGRAGNVGGDARAFLAYAVADASGACTVSVAFGGTAVFLGFSITEFSGAAPGAVRTACDFGTSTDPKVNIIADANALVLGCVMWRVQTTCTPDGSWVQIGEGENWSASTTHNVVRQIVSGAGTYTPDWTLGTSADWCAMALVVPVAASAGGGLIIGGGLGIRGIGVF